MRYRGLGFKQCPVDHEMFMRSQLPPLSQRNHLAIEGTCDVIGKELIPLLLVAAQTFVHRQAIKTAVHLPFQAVQRAASCLGLS